MCPGLERRRQLGRPAIHALEPLEDRYFMSAGAAAEVSANVADGASSTRFAPVYAQLSNGRAVRLGYIQYHNSLDLRAAAEAAADARGDGGATLWKPSLTPDGLILLTPVLRAGDGGGTVARNGDPDGDPFGVLPDTADAPRGSLLTQRSAALTALADAPMASPGDDAAAANAAAGGAIGTVETTHSGSTDVAGRQAHPAGADALARLAERGTSFAAIVSRGGTSARTIARDGFLTAARETAADWVANVLAGHVPLRNFAARVAARATPAAASSGMVATVSPSAAAGPNANAHYFGFSHLDLPYTLAVDSIAAFAEESAQLSAAVGSRARSALSVSDRSAAWGFTLAVLAADLALLGYIYRGTVRDRDAMALPDRSAR